MKGIGITLVLIFMSLASYGQDAYNRVEGLGSEELLLKQKGTRLITRPGQRYMIVDHTSFLAGFQRYRFFPGENIRFRLYNSTVKFNEQIGEVSDSSFTFLMVNEAIGRVEHREVLLKDVRQIKTVRRVPWVTEAGVLLPLAGLIYLGADLLNKGVDDKRFTTDTQTVAVSGGLIAAGLISYKATFATIRLGKKNEIKIFQTY